MSKESSSSVVKREKEPINFYRLPPEVLKEFVFPYLSATAFFNIFLTSRYLNYLSATSLGCLKYFTPRSSDGIENYTMLLANGGFIRSLETLDLSKTPDITDKELLNILKLNPHIKRIDASKCTKLTDRSLIAIARNCIELEYLNFSECNLITDEGLLLVAEFCKNLKIVGLGGCAGVTGVGVIGLVRKCKEITRLYVNGCRNIFDECLEEIANNCPKLRALNIKRCRQVGDRGVMAIADKCRGLVSLGLDDCNLITDTSLCDIARKCPNLEAFSINRCYRVTYQGGISDIMTKTKIENFSVRGCDAIDNNVLRSISALRPQMKMLDFSYCDITDEGVCFVADNCRGLKAFFVQGCEGVTPQSLHRIYETNPKVRIIAPDGKELERLRAHQDRLLMQRSRGVSCSVM